MFGVEGEMTLLPSHPLSVVVDGDDVVILSRLLQFDVEGEECGAVDIEGEVGPLPVKILGREGHFIHAFPFVSALSSRKASAASSFMSASISVALRQKSFSSGVKALQFSVPSFSMPVITI